VIWLPRSRAAWIWAAVLPTLWIAPALLALRFTGAFGRGGEPVLITLGLYGCLFLPVFLGAPSAYVLRPVGVGGWVWLLLNAVCGVAAAMFVGLVNFGT
jgi:hypothetical protein